MPRTIHEVDKNGNLYFLLNGFNGALNKLAEQVGAGLRDIGGGLRAVALALSTPQDNSAQVQQEVDRLVKELRGSTTKVETAINEQSTH